MKFALISFLVATISFVAMGEESDRGDDQTCSELGDTSFLQHTLKVDQTLSKDYLALKAKHETFQRKYVSMQIELEATQKKLQQMQTNYDAVLEELAFVKQ